MTAKLTRLDNAVNAAHIALNQEFEREFPVGTHITWLYQGIHAQSGIVEYCDSFGNIDPRMRVRNDRTRKLVWVGLSDKPKRRQDGL